MRVIRLRSLLSLLLTLVFIISFGYLGYMGMAWFFQSVTDRFLNKWTPLGTPPGKAVSVLATSSQSVMQKTIVITADGKFYAYQPGSVSNWVETSWSYPKNINLNPTCPGFVRPRPSLPHAINDCKGSFTWEWQSTEDFFAVLDDGSVWRWQYGVGLMEGLKRLLLVVSITTLGAISGFLLSKPVRFYVLKDMK
jgi:hypothetical protein